MFIHKKLEGCYRRLIRIIKNAHEKFDKLFDASVIDDAVNIIRDEQINMKKNREGR